MSTSVTRPCLFAPSSSPLARAAPGTAIRAPRARAAADPARNLRREVGASIGFSLRYVPSLMSLLSLSRKASISLSHHRCMFYLSCIVLPPFALATNGNWPSEADEHPFGSRLRHWLHPCLDAHVLRDGPQSLHRVSGSMPAFSITYPGDARIIRKPKNPGRERNVTFRERLYGRRVA